MSLITLAYSIPVGVQRAQDQLARIAAIDLTLGELDLLQMSVFDDSVFEDLGQVIRRVTLEPSAQGEAAFPTDQAKVDATVGLYGGQLDLNVPSNVVRAPPVVEAVTPLDFGGVSVAGLFEWWRADMAVTEDASHLVSAWDNKAPGFPGSLTAAAGSRPTHAESSANFGQMVVNFTGTQFMDSDLAASAWNRLHDGGGVTIFVVTRPTDVAVSQVFLSTAEIGTNNRGINLWYDGVGRTWTWQVGNGAALVFGTTSAGVATPLTRQVVVARFLEGRPGNEWSLLVNGSETTGNTAAAPAAGDAEAPLRVARSSVSGASPYSGNVPEIFMYGSYLSDEDVDAITADYLVPRYGTFP